MNQSCRYKRLPNKYIFEDPNIHYVHHLSKFEHDNTEKYGFAEVSIIIAKRTIHTYIHTHRHNENLIFLLNQAQ